MPVTCRSALRARSDVFSRVAPIGPRPQGDQEMYPCGNCRAVAVGPDGRCAACGTYQQQLNPAPTAGPGGYAAAPPVSMPAAGAMPPGGVDLRRGLATTLTVLFSLMIPTLILVMIGRGGQYGVVSDMLSNNGDVSLDDANEADSFYVAMTGLNALVAIPATIVWAIWFRRLRLNAEAFAPGQHRMSPGWAAGSWFTPVVNLWFPKQIANDIWRASSPQGPHQVNRALLNGWWVTLLVSIGVGLMGSVQYTAADTKLTQLETGDVSGFGEVRGVIEDMKSALGISIFAMVITIAAAILALLLVRQITAMQEQRAALPPQGPQGQMPPSPYGAPAPNPYGGGAPGNPYGAPAPSPYGGGAPQMPPVVPQAPPAPPSGPPGGSPYGQG
ncbi:DUF4328 domain-containing protein [Streptomyces botrytidirepellens]|uniref:DUF4328 domain-containing protein n=2 Tax=Streptomyces botrytidirepellens TaxID=2486417 RepID=A0A3M8T791_9ACTN|nr:DUF4328 domain-containing protein [Streptomyces botrytidirepellens]